LNGDWPNKLAKGVVVGMVIILCDPVLTAA